ncbi:MAG: oxidoreductase [Proteobacteria bacterium]|nr:oxidoreductase [Pseudomonadota bacterium]RZO99058.1 MAG: aldo/keto reductase [Gammaproteobacteria bacterium]|tara:strand:+ start:555 stop:1535 length:981 start_codon:yes stop_codon:yes gene_type:complete
MEQREFKPFGTISALTLGGGGIGNVWGETTRSESISAVNLAIESGVNHLDIAPMYGKGEAEKVVGEALIGKDHSAINLTTKCRLGTVPDSEVYTRLNNSLCRSLETMRVEKVNLFLLHSQLIEDDYQLPLLNEYRAVNATTLSCYYSAVIPAFEMLKKEGKIDHWGIGLGQEEALIKAINYEQPPEAMQCAVNILNSIGAIGYISEKPDPNSVLAECQKKDIPILAIRAVQAGALTSSMDREPHPSGMDNADFTDFERASPFRKLAKDWDESPASLAHRYALSVEKVSSVILGIKNRKELQECIDAEKKGKLSSHEMETLQNLFVD